MANFLNVLQYLVLTLWVGSMFGFGALFAPVLFRSLSSRDQAGAIAGEALARIDSLGLVSGGVLVVVTVLQSMEAGWRAIDLARVLAAALMLALVLVNAVSVRQRLTAVRQQMGRPIDEFAPTDPLRAEYSKYHRLSRTLFSLVMLLGLLLIGLSAVR
jgi:hypothetical protein